MALYRIRVGRSIGSAALVADGLHARTDGSPRCLGTRCARGVDPRLVESAERALAAEPGVVGVRRLRMRWIGHRLHADVEPDITLSQTHQLAHDAEHTLTHAVPRLSAALIHAYPQRPAPAP